MKVAACWKMVDLRPEVDPLTGEVHEDVHTVGVSDADRAALEWALRLGEAWRASTVALAGGPPGVEVMLREALAAGAGEARRVELDPTRTSAEVAVGLAAALGDVDVVVCGDWSIDRGTGSVPAYLADELGAAQALGLVGVDFDASDPGGLRAERRLDGGRRERLALRAPAVVSVEGASARLRRAALPAVLRSARAPVSVVVAPPVAPLPSTLVDHGPFRPRPHVLPAPDRSLTPRERVLALTGALVPRTPPERLVLDPPAAADAILDRLRVWGYV